MFNCVPRMSLLPVKKKETNYLIWFYIIAYSFINGPVFIDVRGSHPVLDNFSPLFLELKNHYQHVLKSPRYISGFQTFRVIITLFEMINEQRLKTEPYLACFLFFLSSKSTSKKSSLSDGHFKIYKCWF